MWDYVWNNNHMEIEKNAADKLLALTLKQSGLRGPVRLQLNQSELCELLSTLLDINRSFSGERPYFADRTTE